jgi:hypothetical protein
LLLLFLLENLYSVEIQNLNCRVMKKVLKPKRKMLSVMFTAWGMIFIENDVLIYFRAHSICSGVQKKIQFLRVRILKILSAREIKQEHIFQFQNFWIPLYKLIRVLWICFELIRTNVKKEQLQNQNFGKHFEKFLEILVVKTFCSAWNLSWIWMFKRYDWKKPAKNVSNFEFGSIVGSHLFIFF